jgi:hypothetical protein
MLMRTVCLLLLGLVACKPSREACETTVDEAFEHHRTVSHEIHEAEGRAHSERRLELLDTQYDEDRTLERRRDVTVDRCVADGWTENQRECVTHNDVEGCLNDEQRRALAGARPRLSAAQWFAAYQNFTNRMCHCRDRACADRTNDAQRRFYDATDHVAGTPNADAAEADVNRRYAECQAQAMTVEVVTAPPRGAMPPRCFAYLAAIEDTARCPQLAVSHDTLRQAADSMRDGFAQLSDLPPEAWKAADDGCGQALDAIRQALRAANCQTLPD